MRCKFCMPPNKTIVTHSLGLSAFVGVSSLMLRFDDKEQNKTILALEKINFCPMCGRKLTEAK